VDYTSLVTAVQTRLNRVDLNSLIPDFVARAEDEIFARLASSPVRPMVCQAVQDVTEQTIAVPSNFIDVIDLWITSGDDTWQLVRLDPSDPTDYYATRALPYRTRYDSSKIRHYTIVGNTIYLSSAPTETLSMTLRMYEKPDRLSAGVLTNWVIESHADVYEFGTLAHAYRQERDDEAESRYIDKFMGAIDLMLGAYPERQNPSELRASDLPMSSLGWNIVSG
jgi:hypothetical protein